HPSPDYSYRLTSSDAVECSVNHIITFRSGDPLMVRIPHQTTTPGAEICVPLTVQDFNDVGTFQFVLAWNPSILAFNSVNYKNPILSANGSSLADNQEFADQGLIFFSWYTFSATAIEIPDQDTLIEVCFEAVGDPGERTEVTMGPYNSTGIDFTDIDGPINFEIENGSVTIIPSSDLDFSHSACGSGDELNLTVQIFGGRAPYSYELTGPSIQSDDDVGSNISIDNLPEGEYTLRII